MEAKPIITLKQMLAHMEAAVEPFALRYVKYNEQKGAGGELVPISGQLLSGKGRAEAAPLVGPGPDAGEALEAWVRRNPHHGVNMTRNLVSTVNGRYTKVHIYLITEFEGKRVVI